MKKALVGMLFGWVLIGSAQAELRLDQKNNTAMLRLGAATATDLLEKEAGLCFSRAMFVVRGYELREKKEQLKAQLEGDFKSLPEEYKRLLLRGASVGKLDPKELSADFEQCIKDATRQVGEALRP